MKIRKLTIKNIASIESAEIDFERGTLGEASIFLICGETGSGKTTILDCITLALYGVTPRYNGKKVLNAQEIGAYAFNDARQIVRSDATSASAKLSLIGNDGKAYEAEWSVEAISRGINKGQLKKEDWRWKDCSAGGVVVWTKARECEAIAQKAIGFGFEQFCRTTMLAQGQFTKFLLGEPKEKAEILEKLTDTSRYSELGKAIAAKYIRLDNDVKALKAKIEGMTVFGDQREQIMNRIKELGGKIEETDKKINAANAKLQWMRRRDELAANAENVHGKLIVAFAALKALERNVLDEFAVADAKFQALKEYLVDNAGNAAMYESASVILQDLADARKAWKDKAVAEEELNKCKQELPGLIQRVEDFKALQEKTMRELAAAEETSSAEEDKLEALDRNGVQNAKSREEEQRGVLLGLIERINGIARMIASVEARKQELSRQKKYLAELECKQPMLKSDMECAREAVVRARANRDVQKKLVEDGIEKLVADLKVGDTCPICGGKIETLHSSGHFEMLFRTLDAECAKAEEMSIEKDQCYNEVSAAIIAFRNAIALMVKSIEAEKAMIEVEKSALSETARRYVAKDVTLESVKAALEACGAKIAAFDAMLSNIARQEMKVKDIQKVLNRLRDAKDKVYANATIAESNVESCLNRINIKQISIDTADRQAKEKLANVAGRVFIPGWLESWEKDAETVESMFKVAADEYAARKVALLKAKHELSTFENEGKKIAECIRRAVAKVATLAEVMGGDVAAVSTAEMDSLLGRFEETKNALEKHIAARPENIQDTDTIESLSSLCDKLKDEKEQDISDCGKYQQQIADDDKRMLELAEKRAEMDRLISERNEWHPIYKIFGDDDGSKIRREIQSYVLTNVLVKANYYLKQLSERYELSCEGLTLSVLDMFEGGTVRPVNTLSGGEQFLVSLALALGLAGMSDTGLGVDMLLIDEGFGTLSGEHLNSVINALERLNVLTGSRKVGVISHVESLRERIRTHIEVKRNGHDPSEVTVVVQ